MKVVSGCRGATFCVQLLRQGPQGPGTSSLCNSRTNTSKSSRRCISGRLQSTLVGATVTSTPPADWHQQHGKLRESYLQGPGHTPLIGATLGQVLTSNAERYADTELFVFLQSGIRKTFAEFNKDVDKLATGFLGIDLKPGDRVGIWGPNSYEWVLTQFAAAKAGLILVNINPAYRVNELEYCLHKVGVKAIVSDEAFKTQDYYSMLREICPELEYCKPGQLISKRLPELQNVIIYPGGKSFDGTYALSEVSDAGGKHERDQLHSLNEQLQFDQPTNIQFTSGTTGHPKGSVLSHHNLVNNGYFIGSRLMGDAEFLRICYPVPLYHCFGCVGASICSVIHGFTAVSPSKEYDPMKTLQAVQQERCNTLYGTPTMFIDMLHDPQFDSYNLTSLSRGIMAGAPCPEELMKTVIVKMHMDKVEVAYGTTENSPVTFQGFPDDDIEKRCGTIGYPSDHIEVKVVDPSNGNIVPVNTPGELCTRGYAVFHGYWEDKEKTDETVSVDRWYKTGDLAVIDEDGYGKIVGRIKDMIIRGGENIYPREIEEFLHQHPQIADVQITGVPDERMGEELCAWVKVKADETLTEQEVKDFCKGKIAHYKIPRYILFVGAYPMTVSGKVQKYIMREEAIKLLNLKS